MIVSMISLMSHTIINTARTPALADPNVTKFFQRCVPAFSAILSSDCSSRFIMDILPSGRHCRMAPLMFSMDGFSTGNIIWFDPDHWLSRFRLWLLGLLPLCIVGPWSCRNPVVVEVVHKFLRFR